MHINYKLIIVHVFAWICLIVSPAFIRVNETSELFLTMCLLICASVIIYAPVALMYNVLHCGNESNSIMKVTTWFLIESGADNFKHIIIYIQSWSWLLVFALLNVTNMIMLASISPLKVISSLHNIMLFLAFTAYAMFSLFVMGVCAILVIYSMFKIYKNNGN